MSCHFPPLVVYYSAGRERQKPYLYPGPRDYDAHHSRGLPCALVRNPRLSAAGLCFGLARPARNWSDSLQEIIFRVTETTYGMPDPPIPDESSVIVFNDRRAKVCRYKEPTSGDPFPRFKPAANWEALEGEALEAIRISYPLYRRAWNWLRGHGRYRKAHIYTCPLGLSQQAFWQEGA